LATTILLVLLLAAVEAVPISSSTRNRHPHP
jgi:hypothetical protein